MFLSNCCSEPMIEDSHFCSKCEKQDDKVEATNIKFIIDWLGMSDYYFKMNIYNRNNRKIWINAGKFKMELYEILKNRFQNCFVFYSETSDSISVELKEN